MSAPLVCRMSLTHDCTASRSTSPGWMMLREVTLLSCSCSPAVLRNSGSISSVRLRSKPRMSSTLSTEISELSVRMMGAKPLSERSRFSTRSRSASETRSVLLSSMRSANATCSTASFSAPSAFSSSRCCSMCLASTSVTMPSSLANSLIDSSMKKVCATGPGSASPVVSMIMASRSLLKRKSLPRMRMRSPRTVQQMHPLFISKMSSSVLNLFLMSESSTPTSPNSFSMTAILFPWLAVRI
mmetsp:Transcript_74180/g.179211  ORF Transcript_74180/g.179211 Transcript_74180/m.179211 type:complete len:242 (+) Transcript_74180:611-1336(+)